MRKLGRYELGKTGIIALQADPRVSYAAYIPSRYDVAKSETQRFDLIIGQHGSARLVREYRNGFADLAERRNAFVLSPLFPIGLVEVGDADGFKRLEFRGLRYDLLLWAMVEELETRYGVAFERIVIHGFSGGGQFVHRFAYLHAHRLHAISVGAPGKVTLLDDDRDWWVGTRDVERRFGRPIDREALRHLHVQLIVGADDTDTDEITVEPDSPLWMDGANDAGVTRIDRLRTLSDNWKRNGIDNELELAAGVGHKGTTGIMDAVNRFFDRALDAKRN
ncbi:hypothetical protein [Roseiterribacter gracilis]